jgi:hypothetical protein
VLDGPADDVESLINNLVKKTGALIDYHYSSGRANVFYIGNDETYQEIIGIIQKHKNESKIKIVEIVKL